MKCFSIGSWASLASDMASHLGWGESQEGAGHHDRNARKFPRGDAWRSRQLLVGAMLPLLLASCKGADKGVAVESSRHALVVGSTVAYEAEVLTRTASATGRHQMTGHYR